MHEFDAVTKTSLATAALRAVENRRADRIVADPLAERLAGLAAPTILDQLDEPEDRPVWAGGPSLGALCDYMAVRTRFFDDYLISAVAKYDIRQIVIGGAGMDSRSYRLTWPFPLRLYELDRAAVLAAKQRELDGVSPPEACTRLSVAADLADPGWGSRLVQAGFVADQPSAWLFEGVFLYLPAKVVYRIFERVQEASATGSLMAADVITQALLITMRQRVAECDRPAEWEFGTDAPGLLWRRYGFTAQTMPADVVAEYYSNGSDRRMRLDEDTSQINFVVGQLNKTAD